MESRTCKVCGFQNAQTTIFRAKEMMYGMRHEFDYFQCSNCQCLQICDFPPNIADYYPSDYYSFSPYQGKKFKGPFGFVTVALTRASIFRKGPFQKILHFLSPIAKFDFFRGLDVSPESRVLESGCGNGKKLVYPLAEIGFKNVLGCDPFIPHDLKYSNGLTILKKDVLGISGNWDIIIYDHAFEHIPNPQENLNKVAELLDPGGVCVLRIPTVPNYAWSHYKTNWVQLDAPRHYFLHSPKSMEIMASKAGLKLKNIRYDSTHFQFRGSEDYVANVALNARSSKGVAAFFRRKTDKFRWRSTVKNLNKRGEGDQAIFYLYKE